MAGGDTGKSSGAAPGRCDGEFLDDLLLGKRGVGSPTTVLSKSYTRKMATEFSAIGTVARQLGFRGVCVDVEIIISFDSHPIGGLTHP
jgi:hypothetical protein